MTVQKNASRKAYEYETMDRVFFFGAFGALSIATLLSLSTESRAFDDKLTVTSAFPAVTTSY